MTNRKPGRPSTCEEHRDTILDARRRGLKWPEIADLIARARAPRKGVTVRALEQWYRRQQPGVVARATESPPATPDAPSAPEPADDRGRMLSRLETVLDKLTVLGDTAQAGGAHVLFVQCQKAIKDVAALVAKLSPPAPRDANEVPDVRASAEAARRDLRDAVRAAVEWDRSRPRD